MADKTLDKTTELTKAVKELNRNLEKTDKTSDSVFKKYEKKVKKSKEGTDALAESFRTFRKVMEGISSQGLSDTMSEMPNYIKGVSKLSSSFSSYSKEVEKTSHMMETMGISFSKTMRDLEVKSSGVSKSMADLVNKANKLASVKDSLIEVPKQLKMIQDSMSASPKIDIKNVDQLNKMLDSVKSNISEVDFKDLQGKIEKLGKGVNTSEIAKSIQKKLEGIEVTSEIIGGEEAAKKFVQDISAEINKLQDLKPGEALINEFLGTLKTLKEDSSLSDVFEKHKKEISEFEQALAKPGVTYDSVANLIIDLNGKISDSLKTSMESFDKESDNLVKSMDEIRKGQEELAKKFREGYKLSFHTEEAVAEFSGILSDLSAKAYTIQARNIIPDEEIMKTAELQEAFKELNRLNEENKLINEEIESGKAEELGTLEKLKKSQEDNLRSIKKQLGVMRDLEKNANDYADNVIRASESGFGVKKAENLSNEFYGISGSLKKLGSDLGENSTIGKGLSKLGGLAGKFGENLRKLSFPLAIVTGAIAATKALLKMQTAYANMNKEALMTGAMARVTGDATAAFTELNTKLNNTSGLMTAAMGGKEFGLAREEIIGITNSLRDGGVAVQDLKKGMAGVETTAAAVKNEYLGAANMVTTFSTELGVAPGVIAQSIGEMTYDYNENLGSIRDTYTQIAAASKDSGMSQTRFLAAVQTATAGLSIYESQVASVAKMIATLGKDEQMTGKAAETLAKNMTGFARDADKVTIAFSQMGPEQKKAMQEAVRNDIERLKKRAKAGDKEAQNELKIRQDWLKKSEAGDWGESQAAEVKYLGAEAQAQVFAAAMEAAVKASNGNTYALEKVATQFGIAPEAIEQAFKSSGGDVNKVKEAILKSAKESDKTQADFKDMQDGSFNKQQQTADAMNKALESIEKQVLTHFGPYLSMLTKIFAAIGAISGVASLIKGMRGPKGPGGGAGGERKGFSKVTGWFKDKISGGGAAAVDAAATTTKPLTEAATKSGGKLSKLGGAIKGSKIAKMGGSALKGAGKLLKFARGIPIAGTLIGAGFLAKDVINIFAKDGPVTKGDLTRLGMSALSMVPVVGTAAVVADAGMELAGGYDALDNLGKPTLSDPSALGLAGTSLPKAGGDSPLGEGLSDVSGATLAQRAKQGALSTVASAGGRHVSNTNNFYINGNNPEHLKRVILNTLVQYEKGKA